ncbi:MAG: hypothetical protein J0G95_11350 [Rhizobiales bacterium]|nr:hypothetical protein [Hyphomicrobiales bacterium]
MTRYRAIAVLCLAAGIIVVAGIFFDARTTLAAYLIAWVATASIPIGALALLQMTYLVHRAWTNDLHRILIAATETLPLCGLLALPILLGQPELYPAAEGSVDLPAFKAAYLSPWFFATRTIVFFAIWYALAFWAKAAWKNPDRMARAASVGLIVYALTASLAGIDWLQSLNPEFHSSIYGLLFISFTWMSGLAFALGVGLSSHTWIPSARGYGGLFLSMILLWAYLHAMQYIVIWSGNIPDEVTWYLARSTDGWQYVVMLLASAQFVGPFLLLLSERARRDRKVLLGLCIATLVLRVVEALVLAAPGIHGLNGSLLPAVLIAVTILIATAWGTFFVRQFMPTNVTANGPNVPSEASGQAKLRETELSCRRQ